MASYKVSYKVLSQQGETLKALAKEVDGYASRIDNIRSRLGNDNLLASVRQNLQKLSQQLGESRVVLNMAGEVVEQCVQGYNKIEVTVVKQVDSVRAHNRDFYKNPVSVPSAGGGAVAAAGAGAAAMAGSGTGPAPAAAEPVQNIQYTDNSAHVSSVSYQTTAPAADTAAPLAQTLQTEAAPVKAASSGGGMSGAAIGAVSAAAGVAVGGGALFGAQRLNQYLKDKKEKEQTEKSEKTEKTAEAPEQEEDDPEVLLAHAMAEAEKNRRPEPEPDTTPKFGSC